MNEILVEKSKETRDGNLFWEKNTKLILDKPNVTVCAECKRITIELIGGLLWTQRNLLSGYVHMNPSRNAV